MFATTRYVNANNTTPASPYTSWATAATNIQDAINAAGFGETIWVADGTYKAGSVGNPYNARIHTQGKYPVIQSVNGPEVTIIKGITNGASLLCCAYLTSGSVLSGFTLTNGSGPAHGGGGVYCESSDCIVTNCIIAGNMSTATLGGGGAHGGTLLNCILTNNAAGLGGGAASNTLINCTLANNTAAGGGGAKTCLLSNCLLVANISSSSGNAGGGAANCVLDNCTVSNNAAYNGGGVYFCNVNDSLISSNRASGGSGGGEYLSTLSNCVVQNNFENGTGGAGAYQGALTNCILQNNVATFAGAGAYNSTLVNCTVANNSITAPSGLGGGTYLSALYNCLVVGNTATHGAGVNGGLAKNSTIVGNVATYSGNGGGASGAQLYNSIIYYNQASTNADTDSCPLTDCCTSSLNYTTVINSFTNEPLFLDPNGDFHLQSGSPCINSGNNSYSINSPDLDGNQRIVGGTIDAGAYEFQSPSSVISYAWLQQYGLPTDGSVDYSDDDTDGMNTWQEWIAGTDPTNTSSLLQMQSAVPSVDFSTVAVSWQSVSGKTYFLQRSTNLPVFSTVQSNIAGQAGTTTYADTSAGTGPSFYRVAVQ